MRWASVFVVSLLPASTIVTAAESPSYRGSLVCERDHVSGRAASHAGLVTVHVMAYDGEPLPDVKVTLLKGSLAQASAVSDSSGRVAFKELTTGADSVVAELRGFVRASASLPAVRRGCIVAISIPMSVVDITN